MWDGQKEQPDVLWVGSVLVDYRGEDGIQWLGQLEDMLENASIIEMMEIIGRQDCFWDLLNKIILLDIKETDDFVKKSWLKNLILLGKRDGQEVDVEDVVNLMIEFIMEDKNRSCVGMEYFSVLLEQCDDKLMQKLYSNIDRSVKKYKSYLSGLSEDVWLSGI